MEEDKSNTHEEEVAVHGFAEASFVLLWRDNRRSSGLG